MPSKAFLRTAIVNRAAWVSLDGPTRGSMRGHFECSLYKTPTRDTTRASSSSFERARGAESSGSPVYAPQAPSRRSERIWIPNRGSSVALFPPSTGGSLS